MIRLVQIVIAATAALWCACACAQIQIGQTAGFSGPVAGGVKEATQGARMYFDMVNSTGGVRGQRIELVSLDDGFEPEFAGENARKLIEDHHVLAMFLTRGTPHTQAIIPLLDKHGVPLVAPSTGAMVLHEPLQRYVFNVRTPYQLEAERAVRHLHDVGVRRVVVVHADDSFGRDALAGANKGFAAVKLEPLAVLKADRAKPDFDSIVRSIIKTRALAVVWLGSGTSVADGVRRLRDAGSAALVITLSNNAASGFIEALGPHRRGVMVTQVFPSERMAAQPMVAEALRIAKAHGNVKLSPAMLEGFAAAKVLVEGLRRASPNPTREKLVAALEGMNKFDLGGYMHVGYSRQDHTGLTFVDLSIITAEGNFRR